MAISLGINVQSLNAQRNLTNTSGKLNSVYQQLSSGQRINKAVDDAAGLAIADGLKRDQRIATQAIRNANDGISVLAIADGALGEMNNILNRMGELAQQSANGVYNNNQRSALATEFNALGSEISRISFNTEFNQVKLLSSTSNIVLQVGFKGDSNSQIALANLTTTLSTIGLTTAASGQGMGYSIAGATISDSQSAARLALDSIRTAIGSISALRGSVGAGESRLRSAVNSMAIARENYAAAESQIRDADIASSAAELTRLNILQQAGASILGQANQAPQLALSLIR